MSVIISAVVFKPLYWQTIIGLLIIRLIWLCVLYPFLRMAGSWLAWSIMWELSALKYVAKTTYLCSRRNGGTLEQEPGRLAYQDWLIHHGCVGREAGHQYPVVVGVSQDSRRKMKTY
jgi:hypothetical protein